MNLLNAFDVGLNFCSIQFDPICMAEEVAETTQSMEQCACLAAQKAWPDTLYIKRHAVDKFTVPARCIINVVFVSSGNYLQQVFDRTIVVVELKTAPSKTTGSPLANCASRSSNFVKTSSS